MEAKKAGFKLTVKKPLEKALRNVLRKEGHGKITGSTRYIDDLQPAEVLYGATIRSPIARGKITQIEFAPEIPWGEFTIVTAQDIPGKRHVALILEDQPFLASQNVNHPEEPILLIAHPNPAFLEKARKKIRIHIDPLPAVFDMEASLSGQEIIWGQDNIFKSYKVEKGNVDLIWQRAEHIVEGEYFTGAQEQLYIENNGMIAEASLQHGVTVRGSMQCPYYIHKGLKSLFAEPSERIRIIQAETGGGFGGKEEYPTLIAGHAALLALKSGKPVKMIYDRAEDMVATTKRHPSRTRIKTAVNSDGNLLAMEIDFLIDGGAYATLSSVVLSRGTIHAAGPYLCPNVRIQARAVATNSPPHGAFRGFGAPQSIFAFERHMDRIAEKLKLDPAELRRRNFLRTGELTATQQLVRDEIDMSALLDTALQVSDYHRKKAEFAAQNSAASGKNEKSRIKRGIGLASFFHGSGFTGSGEKFLGSTVAIEGTPEGRVRILAASTEIGQGTNTVFSQIAAGALKVDYDLIEVATPDTAKVPDSGPTVASRTVMIVGKLIETACLGLLRTLTQAQLLLEPYTSAQFQKACATYVEQWGPLRSDASYKQPDTIQWDDEKYRGDAYAAYAWAVYVAEVSVDLVTYETRVDRFYAIQDVGHVVHPLLAAGQIEGGVTQGIGYALYEKVIWKDGRMANARMTNYIIPTSVDTPPIEVVFKESSSPNGPGGAKGIGELPMDGPAPAILSAIENATCLRLNRIPCLPEDLMAAQAAERENQKR